MTRSASVVTGVAMRSALWRAASVSQDRPPMTSTVLMAMSSGVLEAAASVGLDAEALREAAGIGRDELADPDARLPLERHLRLWELLSRHPLGLEIGARMGLAGMGVIGYAMQHGESVGDALAWLWRYRAVIHPEVVPAFEVRPGGSGSELVFSRVVSPAFTRLREPVYAQASAILSVIQTLSGTTIRPLRVRLPMARPADADRVAAFLGCPVTWSEALFEIALPADVLDRALPRADPRLFGYLARRVEELQNALPADAAFVTRARRAIGDLLVRGAPRLPAVAKQLGVSERTLHRRLQEEGASFSALVDDARRERALILLEDATLSASEIAFLLGYAEPAPFFRAFKRWTGETCQAFRRGRRVRTPGVRGARRA